MFTFERTTDTDLIRSVVTHPKVYRSITDDFSPEASEWQPRIDDQIWYIACRNDGIVIAIWTMWPHSPILWEIHTCVLPNAWGGIAHAAVLELLQWIWSSTTCQRLMTNVPEPNRLAYLFALDAGMVEFGRNPRSFQKGGKLIGQILLGMNRPECP